jgi:imidazolonepropionase-like amidohydrolase
MFKNNSGRIVWALTMIFGMILVSACQPAAVPQGERSVVTEAVELTQTNPPSPADPPDNEEEVLPKPTDTSADDTKEGDLVIDDPAQPLVLTNGMLVTATGEDPFPNGTIVVKDGIITEIGLESEIEIPEGAEVIDVDGRTIMPGLIDARASDLLNRLELDEDGQLTVSAKYYLENPLKQGMTTMRATGWDWEKQQNIDSMRAALENLGNTAPTIIIAGTSLTHGEGAAYTLYYPDQLVGVVTPEETRQTTERLLELGVDQISLVMTLTKDPRADAPDPSDLTLTPEQLEAIVEVAHSHGKRVLAQTIFQEDAETVLAAGVDELIAWPVQQVPLSDDLIETLVDREIPVLTGFSVSQIRPQPGDVRRFLDAGGTLVYGTFAPNSGGTPEGETRLMSILGDLTPAEILQAATVNAAEALELGDVIGTLEVGKQADMIVLDGNPLEDIRAYRNVVYVVKNGELVVGPEEE